MSHISLSICIPTYNFGKFIGETIESIIKQIEDDVEIVILDGASTDNTAEIVRSYQRRNLRLFYFCLEKRGGIDCDLAKAVELAHGEYCWLLSSDDIITKNAIIDIKNKLLLNYDVLLFSRINCNIYLEPRKIQYALRSKIKEGIYNFSHDEELINYCRNAVDLSALFSYMSTIIVKKSKWDSIPLEYSSIGTAYSHVYRILSILREGGLLFYSSQPIVFLRMGNDSFETDNKIERYFLDLDGYKKLAEYFFNTNEQLKYYFWGVLRKTHSWRSLYKAKIVAKSKNDWGVMQIKLKKLYFNRTKLFVIRNTSLLFKLLFAIRNSYVVNINNLSIKENISNLKFSLRKK